VICEPWDVVVVPFPFSDRAGDKRRPALVLSRRAFNQSGHTVLAMITAAAHEPWPGDVEVDDLQAAGLSVACRLRLKLFTLDNRLIVRRIGRLASRDQKDAAASLRRHLV
jgi:mRNA interferase MazF